MPAFEFIKTKPGTTIASSVFLMCLRDRILVYGDCAVNPNPNAQELAEIALSSAETARTFGIEPRVAMLSYSTGKSGKGEDVDKIVQATEIAQQLIRDRGLDILLAEKSNDTPSATGRGPGGNVRSAASAKYKRVDSAAGARDSPRPHASLGRLGGCGVIDRVTSATVCRTVRLARIVGVGCAHLTHPTLAAFLEKTARGAERGWQCW